MVRGVGGRRNEQAYECSNEGSNGFHGMSLSCQRLVVIDAASLGELSRLYRKVSQP